MSQLKKSTSLADRTISGMFWSSVQRFGIILVSFTANIVLARLLTPEDFGIIGIIMVFIIISDAFIDGGFASALIQKKRPTNEDYSTIFYWNLFVSSILFIIIFLMAPAIERFYQMQSLAEILRVVSFVLIINAFNIIQFNQLIKKMNFRRLAIIYLLATVMSAIVGIFLAYKGYSVWSLVAKLLAFSFFNCVFLWFSSEWRPSFMFSSTSFKELFGFGSFILMVSVLNKTYDNAQALIIGKVFSIGELGFYTQAKKMQDVPVKGLSTATNQVTFPVFSELQDDLKRMRRGISKSLKSITYLNFPLMVLLIVVAKPLILLLLTDKWSQSIPYFQVLCIAGMLYTLNTANTNIFKSLGRSDTYFYVTLSKRIIGMLMIIAGLQYGIIGMLYAIALNAYLFFFINAYFSAKLSGYIIIQQIKDIAPAFILSVIVGVFTYYFNFFIDGFSLILKLLIQIFIYTILYLLFSYMLKLEAFQIYYEIIIKKIKNR